MYIIPFGELQLFGKYTINILTDKNYIINNNSNDSINIINFPNIWENYINNIDLDNYELILIIYGNRYYYTLNQSFEIKYVGSLKIVFNTGNLKKYNCLRNGYINLSIQKKNKTIKRLDNFSPSFEKGILPFTLFNDFEVNGNTKLYGETLMKKDLDINATINASNLVVNDYTTLNNTTIDGELYITNQLYASNLIVRNNENNSSATNTRNLLPKNHINIRNSIDNQNSPPLALFDGKLEVNDLLNTQGLFVSQYSILNTATINGQLDANSQVNANSLSVNQNTTLNTATVTGQLDANSQVNANSLSVNQNTILNTATVTGQLDANSQVNANSLTVNQNTTLSTATVTGQLDANNQVNANSLSVNQNTILNTATVTGQLDANSQINANSLTVNQNTTLNTATINGQLDAHSQVNADSLNVTNNSVLNTTTINGQLYAHSQVNASDLSVTNNSVLNTATINGQLDANSQVNASSLMVHGVSILNGLTIINNKLNINNDLNASNIKINNIPLNIQHIIGLQAQLDSKLPVVTDDSLSISNTSGLQAQLDSKQANVTDDSLSISNTSGLQAQLDYKQPTVIVDSLSISNTSGLQAQLDSKQANVTDDSLSISNTSGLQAQLDSKQPTIIVDSLSISNTSGLQAQLDNKQPTVIVDSLSISNTSGLQAQLDSKQPTVIADSLSISNISGLQAQLDSKQQTITTNSLSILNTSGLDNTLDEILLRLSNFENTLEIHNKRLFEFVTWRNETLIQGPNSLKTFQTLLSDMDLHEGENQITENFIIIFDMTNIYNMGYIIPNPNRQDTLNELFIKYNNNQYRILDNYDFINAHSPIDLSKWRTPYIDGSNYKININIDDTVSASNTWDLSYYDNTGSLVHSIISGNINNNLNELYGNITVDNTIIEIPVSQKDSATPYGFRIVDGYGTGISKFEVSINSLKTFQTLLNNMQLQPGENIITENFIIIFDMTKTYNSASDTSIDNDENITRSLLNQIYNTSSYEEELNYDDFSNAHAPSDLSKWRAPYIDGNTNYRININVTTDVSASNTWNLSYYTGGTLYHSIISGYISDDYNKLYGDIMFENAIIEIPVSEKNNPNPHGVRIVDNNGDGISEFNVSINLD